MGAACSWQLRTTIYVSTDGQHWTKGILGVGPSSPSDRILGIDYGNGSFIAVGNSGRIMQSGEIFSLGAGSGSPFASLELSLTGQSGKIYRVQTSTNLLQWADLFGITIGAEVVNFIDAGATNCQSR